MLMLRSYRLFEVAYFWGLGGSIPAMLTPDLGVGFPSTEYFGFFVGHTLVVISVLFAIGAFEFRPRLRSIRITAIVTLAYMAAKGDDRISSATFFTTMLDFSAPGELGLFIDEEQLDALDEKMDKDGYLDGSSMSGTFNLLRANDLIWSFYINNYLLGNNPRPFDLLYWNSDSTRMPAEMHRWYLQNFYIDNKLREPGGVEINGVPIDLGVVDIPVCFVSTIEDHIAPWKSTYAGTKLFSGPVEFILGGSGDIAGVVNPPSAGKYGYWTGDDMPESPEGWLDGATYHEGSWWEDWRRWVGRYNGRKVPARTPGDGALEVIEAAPGRYVSMRAG